MRCPRTPLLALSCLLVAAGSVSGQEYSGIFTVPNQVGGVMTLTLQQDGNGAVTGSLSSNGVVFEVQGQVQDGTLTGSMSGPQVMWFEADRSDNELWLTLYGSDANGQPNYEDYQELDLVAQGSTGSAPSGAPTAPAQSDTGVLGGAQQSGGGGILGGGGAASDPYVGTFSDGSVVLELQGGGGQYQGRVSVNGAVYPVSASGGPAGLQGLIQGPQQQFPMTVSPTSGGLVVVESGTQYNLMRQSGAQAQAGAIQPRGVQPGSGQYGYQGAAQPGSAQPGVEGQQGGGGLTSTGKPLAPGFTEDHPMVTEWRSFLNGKKVTRMNSYTSGLSGGYSSRTDVYLCSDRTFAMRDESSVSVDVGGAYGHSGGLSNDRGVWYLITNGQVVGLILEFANGQTEQYRMDFQNNETYANGERVYVTPAEICS